MTSPLPEGQEFVADWTGADAIPAQLANQILCQLGLPTGPESIPDGVYLTFGNASPPIVIGDTELARQQLAAYNGRLPVAPLFRVFLSKDRVQEALTLLQGALETLEQVEAQVRGVRNG
jgi:hypothetical protein